MIVDTSVWVEHFRIGEPALAARLEMGVVLVHPFVIGELACGNLRNRQAIISSLNGLPAPIIADHEEVVGLVDDEGLYGRGIGWIDVHLLASARLSQSPLWTLDRRLNEAAISLGVGL